MTEKVDHYMPLFVGDFMGSTATWTGPERGLYVQALAFQWTSGPLPADLKRLARALGYEWSEFEPLWVIVGTKFRPTDGGIVNARLEDIRERSKEIANKRAKAGAIGGQVRSKRQANGQANAKQNPTIHIQSISKSNPDPKPNPNPKNPTAAAPPSEPGWFGEIRRVYPPRAGDTAWPKALRAMHARVTEGHNPEEFLAGARRYATYIRACGKANTEYVQQAARFFGPDKPFLLAWHPPNEPENAMAEIVRLNGGDGGGRTFEHEDAGTVEASSRLVRSG